MATKKKDASGAALRGAALAKKATAAGKEKGLFDDAEPVPAGVLKKLKLPNDEKISPALKEVLATDSAWLGLSFDEDEPEFDAMSLEDLVEQEFDEEAVPLFGEAYELLGEDCILLGGEGQSRDFLYVGSPDDSGEYPVITVHLGDVPWVGGFLPFDVWAAARLGALTPGEGRAAAPAGYEPTAQALAQENADGRLVFEPKTRDGDGDDDDDDDEDEDEDEEKDDDEE